MMSSSFRGFVGSHDPFADLSHVVGADAAAAQEAEEEDLDLDLTDDDECWSERDQEVPKKRRRIVTAGSSTSDPSPASSRSPSVTESLIQFEGKPSVIILRLWTMMTVTSRPSIVQQPWRRS